MTTLTGSGSPLERTWYFTFGVGHVHPRTGASLANHYTTVTATSPDAARERMMRIFGNRWAFQYESAEKAGVERFGLKYVPCVSYSPGELLPPTGAEHALCTWRLQTIRVFEHLDAPASHQVVPHHPTVAELTATMAEHFVPASAIITNEGPGCQLVLRWERNVA